jgi:hypothetical protein
LSPARVAFLQELQQAELPAGSLRHVVLVHVDDRNAAHESSNTASHARQYNRSEI